MNMISSLLVDRELLRGERKSIREEKASASLRPSYPFSFLTLFSFFLLMRISRKQSWMSSESWRLR
jgi:hypothetical protein